MTTTPLIPAGYADWLTGLKTEIAQARSRAALVVNAELVQLFKVVYEDPDAHWDLYEACEELVDLEDNFQLWRFRHMKTVMRTIGMKHGTGGSSGVGFLQRALDLTFFPELFAVRTEIGQ